MIFVINKTEHAKEKGTKEKGLQVSCCEDKSEETC